MSTDKIYIRVEDDSKLNSAMKLIRENFIGEFGSAPTYLFTANTRKNIL